MLEVRSTGAGTFRSRKSLGNVSNTSLVSLPTVTTNPGVLCRLAIGIVREVERTRPTTQFLPSRLITDKGHPTIILIPKQAHLAAAMPVPFEAFLPYGIILTVWRACSYPTKG